MTSGTVCSPPPPPPRPPTVLRSQMFACVTVEIDVFESSMGVPVGEGDEQEGVVVEEPDSDDE